MIQPPSVGPKTEETPKTAAKRPWNLARWAGGKMSPMTAKRMPVIMPAPIPCTARKTISWVIPSPGRPGMSPAAPQRAEAATKRTVPPRKNHLRP